MKVNMVLLMRGENNGDSVSFVPALYDQETNKGEVLRTKDVQFTDFVCEALNQMDTMSTHTVMVNARALYHNDGGEPVTELSDQQCADLYMRFLASFSELPMEMVGNMLAGTLTGCIVGLLADDNVAEIVDEWDSLNPSSE